MVYFDCFKTTRELTRSEDYVLHGKTEINMSGIYTKLIQTAGMLCEAYASDLLFDINNIEEALKKHQDEIFYLGFREMGVDHNAFIQTKDPVSIESYRTIYRVVLNFEEDDYYDYKVTSILEKVHYSDSEHYWKNTIKKEG